MTAFGEVGGSESQTTAKKAAMTTDELASFLNVRAIPARATSIFIRLMGVCRKYSVGSFDARGSSPPDNFFVLLD